MYEKEIEEILDVRKKYEEVPIPESIDQSIMSGIAKASQTRKRKNRLKTIIPSAAFAALLFFSVISIRISPAFATFVSQVPGLDNIVALIQGDRGLESAIHHDYFQTVGVTDTEQGITFKIDQIILDEHRLILFYSIKAGQDYSILTPTEMEITNQDGKNIIGSSIIESLIGVKTGEWANGKMDIGLSEPATEIPETLNMSFGLKSDRDSAILENVHWKFSVQVDKEKFKKNKEVITLEKTAEIAGQRIIFKEMTVYPTTIAIHVVYPERNTKQLFEFEDLVVLNEKGEQWASINNGVTATVISDHEEILYLQSNFFERADAGKIFIQFSTIRALDKNKRDVIVDLEKKELVKKPDEQIELLEVINGTDQIMLAFKIKKLNEYQGTFEVFENRYYDQNGVEYYIGSIGSHSDQDKKSFIEEIDIDKTIQNQITFKIIDYPTTITEHVRFQIK